jgi:hypothetical protein
MRFHGRLDPDHGKGKPLLAILLGLALFCSSCGYKVHSSVKSLPQGIQSLGIPTFSNRTPQYRIEQRMTTALLREFGTRTRMPVNSSAEGVDAVLTGEIRNISSSPVTFGTDTFGSAFLVTLQISVKLVRLKDSAVLWEDQGFLFRERYVLKSNVKEFFSEENPALDRLCKSVASSLASTILDR